MHQGRACAGGRELKTDLKAPVFVLLLEIGKGLADIGKLDEAGALLDHGASPWTARATHTRLGNRPVTPVLDLELNLF